MSAGFGAGPWCLGCGELIDHCVVSFDARRPIGACTRDYPDRAGCGRVIGTTDPAEAERAYIARRHRLATSRHATHLSSRRPDPDCDACAAGTQTGAFDSPGTDAPTDQAGAVQPEGGRSWPTHQ